MSTEPLGLTPAQMDQLRAELHAGRRPWALIALAVIVAMVLAASGGYLAGHAQPRIEVRTVNHVEHAVTVKTVTRWRTKTITRTADSGSSTPCVEQSGTVVPAIGGAAAGSAGLTTCSLQIESDVPASDGDQLVITAPDGTSNSYQLGAPTG